MRVAVQPTFTGFGRGDDRMLTRAGMFGRVSVWRVIAATRPTALLARPQVDPLGSYLDAFLAFAALWMFDSRDSTYMCARCVGHRSPLILAVPDARRRSQSILHPPQTPRA